MWPGASLFSTFCLCSALTFFLDWRSDNRETERFWGGEKKWILTVLLSWPSAENLCDCFLETDFMLRLGLGRTIRPSKTSRKVLGATDLNLWMAMVPKTSSAVPCHAKLEAEPFSSPQSILFHYLPISLERSGANVRHGTAALWCRYLELNTATQIHGRSWHRVHCDLNLCSKNVLIDAYSIKDTHALLVCLKLVCTKPSWFVRRMWWSS